MRPRAGPAPGGGLCALIGPRRPRSGLAGGLRDSCGRGATCEQPSEARERRGESDSPLGPCHPRFSQVPSFWASPATRVSVVPGPSIPSHTRPRSPPCVRTWRHRAPSSHASSRESPPVALPRREHALPAPAAGLGSRAAPGGGRGGRAGRLAAVGPGRGRGASRAPKRGSGAFAVRLWEFGGP